MSVSVPDFWKLVIDSRLLTAEQCQMLGAEFGRVKGAANQGNSRTLSQWLISQNALTPYQATILEAGRSGPFHYGDYKVYDRLDQGPFNGAFRAIHEPTSHPVILKFVAGEASRDPATWAELVKRVRSFAAIVHPNLNRIYEPVDLGSYKFVAMEDIPGESLGLRVAGGGPLQWSDACRAVRFAGLGLASLHQAGKIHGDVRPLNIWLESNGHFRQLVDPLFEPQPLHVAQTDAASQLLERSDYMAPELAQQGKSVDVLTDIYGLGCTLYYLLSGRPPFAGGDVMQKMQRHASEAVQPLEQFGVPPQVGQLVMYMMAKNPAVRYQEMSAVVEQITPYIDQAQLNVQPPAPPQTLAAYENWIKRKQSTLATAEASQPASFPAVSVNSAADTSKANSPSSSPAGPVVKTDSDGAATATVTRRSASADASNKNTIMLIAGLSAVALLAIVLLVAMNLSGGSDKVAEDEKDQQPLEKKDDSKSVDAAIVRTSSGRNSSQGNGNDQPQTSPSERLVQTITDDDNLPWAAPTTGKAISFEYVPQSTGIYLIVRPADLSRSTEGAKVLKCLGPNFAAARKQWENSIGFGFEQIEQVVVGVHGDPGQAPRFSYRVRLINPVVESDLLSRWSSPQSVPVSETNTNYYKSGGGLAFFIPPYDVDFGIRQFLVGAEPEVTRVAKGEHLPLLLREPRHLLEQWSDVQNQVTLLFRPASLLDETGQRLFSGPWAKLKDPIDWFLPRDHVQAGLLSAHFGDSYFYMEMRMKSNPSKDGYELARDVQNRLSEIPDRVFNYITTLGSNPYWEKLRFKFPGMIEELHRESRIGTEKDSGGVATAVINCYLPSFAAHNLVKGAELAIASQPGATVIAAGPPKKTIPKNIDELVQMKLDVIDIPQQDLVLAVRDIKNAIADEYGTLPFPFDIKLMGNHLMMNGITQNQKVTDFKRENATYAEILTGICMKANPITTVKEPSELDQKLIWVIAPPSPGADRIILITTRDAAAANNYPLPKPFQPKSG